jgi:hypothetical protein
MRSQVAEEVRREQREEVMRMTPQERLALAARLRERGLAAFMAAHRLTREEAIARIRAQRQAGRRASRCMSE